ncbi:MAG TPA: hypothetical protein VFS21_23690, partial [Roseiflexaceae bacterium]|nr:hypothetical protein [Roseiflexaceae bacterium]
MIQTRTNADRAFELLINTLLIAVLIAVVVPLWRVIMMSLTPLNYTSGWFGMLVPPWEWSVEAYNQLLGHPTFMRSTLNSLTITIGGTLLNLALTIPLAYALSVRTLPGRRIITGLILFTY